MPVSPSHGSIAHAGQQLKALEARSGPADPALLYQGVSGPGLCTQLGEPGILTQEQVAAFPEENAQEHSSDQNAGDSLRNQGHCSTLISAGGGESVMPGGSGRVEAGSLCEMPDSHLNSQQSSPGKVLLTEVAATPLEKVLSMDVVPIDCAYSTVVSELGPQARQDGSILSLLGGRLQLLEDVYSSVAFEFALNVPFSPSWGKQMNFKKNLTFPSLLCLKLYHHEI